MSSFLDSVIKFCVSSMIGCNGFPINLLQEQASSSLSAINGLRVLSLLDSRAFFFSPLFFFFCGGGGGFSISVFLHLGTWVS